MRGITIKNNKLKNGGVLFEVLVRQITADTLAGKTVSPAMDLLKEYFNVSRELGKELQLYQIFFNSRKLSENRAVQLLDMIIAQRKKLDERKLNADKYDLIKHIKKHYDLNEFLRCKVPSYKLYASIYKTFLTETKHQADTILNIQDVASARFTLIEHLLGNNHKTQIKESPAIQEFKQQSEDIRTLTYKLAIDRFNSKYAGLTESQKMLLQTYIHDTSNGVKVVEYVKSILPGIQSSLEEQTEDLTDKVMQIRMHEVLRQLKTIATVTTIKENHLTALMIAMSLLSEMTHD